MLLNDVNLFWPIVNNYIFGQLKLSKVVIELLSKVNNLSVFKILLEVNACNRLLDKSSYYIDGKLLLIKEINELFEIKKLTRLG